MVCAQTRPPTVAIAVLVTLLLASEGCSRSASKQGEKSGRTTRIPLSEMTNEQKLVLFEHVPLGATLSEVKAVAPGLGVPQAEGTPARGLTDAGVALQVLGYHTRAEFNFRQDTLYSVNF